MKDMDELREKYGADQVEETTRVIGLILDRVQDMAERMAVTLENCGDSHGAMAVRLFKDTLMASWGKTVDKCGTIQ